MKNAVLLMMLFAMTTLSGYSQQKQSVELKDGQVVRLYEGVAPGSEEWKLEESTIGNEANSPTFNISVPTITAILPEAGKATGQAMLVCPGGAFCMLSVESEGMMMARELAKRGITAFVLKYRLNPLMNEDGTAVKDITEVTKAIMSASAKAKAKYAEANPDKGEATITQMCFYMENVEKAFADADKAMTIIRRNASEWNIKEDKIGMMGFSAGAITTLYQALNHTAVSRPDFIGLLYGGWTSDIEAPVDAMPLFMVSPTNDIFTVEETTDVFKAWKTVKQPVELHYFNDSQHGFGAIKSGKSVDAWIDLMYDFMKDVDFVTKN